ncbi:unnamed protein product [Paramecium octaurelia]|uniref:Uncharacterized protein n=1 Tax=Paramecium octaurelia TaxID=43137 RepID=A0A8S1YE40_PAROT|nr:unnamed protein product [Paramecium octaurelia]
MKATQATAKKFNFICLKLINNLFGAEIQDRYIYCLDKLKYNQVLPHITIEFSQQHYYSNGNYWDSYLQNIRLIIQNKKCVQCHYNTNQLNYEQYNPTSKFKSKIKEIFKAKKALPQIYPNQTLYDQKLNNEQLEYKRKLISLKRLQQILHQFHLREVESTCQEASVSQIQISLGNYILLHDYEFAAFKLQVLREMIAKYCLNTSLIFF